MPTPLPPPRTTVRVWLCVYMYFKVALTFTKSDGCIIGVFLWLAFLYLLVNFGKEISQNNNSFFKTLLYLFVKNINREL